MLGHIFVSVLVDEVTQCLRRASGTQNGWENKKNKAIGVFNFLADLCSNEDSDLTRSDFSRLVGKR